MKRTSSSWNPGRASLAAVFVPVVLVFCLVPARAQTGSSDGTAEPSFESPAAPPDHHLLLDAWKAARRAAPDPERAGSSGLLPLSTGGTAAVGRASLVINDSGRIAYTRNYVGAADNCDADLGEPISWQKLTTYVAGDHVRPTPNSNSASYFMATNSGTSGGNEPAWRFTFGTTTTDGSVNWAAVGTAWAPGQAYTAGMTVTATQASGNIRTGFTYQAQSGGTSGGTEPFWPTQAGGTVNENGITWKAIGYYPGSFRNCNPMQIVSRAADGGETVIASEGDAVGSVQLSGWGEFIAMNSSGLVAFKAEAMDLIADRDESGTGIFLAGPGAGALTKVATAGDTIGGRYTCGFSTMVGINDSGQVVFDGLTVPPGNSWQSLHVYQAGNFVIPTTPNGLRYKAKTTGTSASAEPAFPTSLNATVSDGSVVWITQTNSYPMGCDEDSHSLIRHSSGKGNELLVGVGSSFAGSTVKGFGSDNVDTNGSTRCSACAYEDIDGRINAAGHVPVVLNFTDGSQGVYNFSGPGVATEVARTKGNHPYSSLFPRVSINNSDQIAFKGVSGFKERIFLFTPPATTVTAVSVGDDVGTRTVGVASGVTFESFGNFFDLNNSGNIVFQAKLSGTQEGFYYWDSALGVLSEIRRQPDISALASEMIAVNDRNLVAYVTGNQEERCYGECPLDHSGGHETGGAFFWQAGKQTKAIAVNDVIGGDLVTSIYAQHQSFVKRQLSESGCLAVAFHVLGDDPGFDCTEGGQTNPCYGEGGSLVKGGQLFVSCMASSRVLALPGPPRLARVPGR